MLLSGIGVHSWSAQLFKLWKDEHKRLGLWAAPATAGGLTWAARTSSLPVMPAPDMKEVRSELTWFP